MDKVPFSAYDFFGCIAPGFLVLISFDYSFNTNFVFEKSLSPEQWIFWVFIAYILGHVISYLSPFLFEDFLIKKYFNRPNVNLLEKSKRKISTHLLFKHYFKLLPEQILKKLSEKIEKEKLPKKGEELFGYVYPKVRECANGIVFSRLNIFLILYTFCKNMCFAGIVAALFLLFGIFWGGVFLKFVFFLMASSLAFVMFLRYLKYFRLFSEEIFCYFALI